MRREAATTELVLFFFCVPFFLQCVRITHHFPHVEFIPYVAHVGDPSRPAQSVHVSATWLDTHETNGAISWTPCRRVNWAATDTAWSANLPADLLQSFSEGKHRRHWHNSRNIISYIPQPIGKAVLLGLWINLFKTKRNQLYIRNQSVPRCKHFPPRL